MRARARLNHRRVEKLIVLAVLAGVALAAVGAAAAAAVPSPKAGTEAVSAGYAFSVAIKGDGSLWTWGANMGGELGRSGGGSVPGPVGRAKTWALVAAGSNHTLALRADGSLWSWGVSSDGRLGRGGTNSVPGRVGSAEDWVAVAAGRAHSLALQRNGTLWSWGANALGQLGRSGDPAVPKRVGTATTWVAIGCGWDSSYAIKSDGTLWSWGANTNGKLGLGDTANRVVPTQVPGITHVSQVISPTTGINGTYIYDNIVLLRHASASDRIARVNGYVMTVGYGTSFIGGPNIPNPQMSFRMVGLPNRYHGKLRRIAVSGFHQGNDGEPQCMALAMDGTVFAWGPSNTFSLGLPENQTANAPMRVRF